MTTLTLTREAGKCEDAGNQLLQEALRYAAQGWHVLPLHNPVNQGCSCEKQDCSSPGKHPRVLKGLKQATTDEVIIRGWWECWPEANVGLATGEASGVIVLDIDGVDGDNSLKRLESLVQLPNTLRAHSGRKGLGGERNSYHLYFTLPSGVNLRNSAGRLGKGLDVRGSGGYIVAPPSRHISGLFYEWDSDAREIAELPQWYITKASMPTLAVVRASKNGIPHGQRNSTLASLAGIMHSRKMSRISIQAALLSENLQNCHPPIAEEEVMSIVASITSYPQGEATPRKLHRADVRCLADVQAEEVDWLWEPYIPLKMITLLSGDPGVGKTYLALALAAAVTRGENTVTGSAGEAANVLYLTNENSPSHVLRPRFDALSGDASRFFTVSGTLAADGKPGSVTLGDTETLKDAIHEARDARLVVIDPLQSFLGGSVDAHRMNQTRPIMDGLILLAERTGCAILITRHLSKGIGGSALYRGMGSIDFTGAARSELLVARDPDQDGRIVMAHSKSNLGQFGPSLAFSIDSGGKLQWHGESSLRADDLLDAPATADQRSALDDAVEFLREVLVAGLTPSNDVQTKAREKGISNATLRRAQAQLKVKKAPQGFNGQWMLSLPTVAQESLELLNALP